MKYLIIIICVTPHHCINIIFPPIAKNHQKQKAFLHAHTLNWLDYNKNPKK